MTQLNVSFETEDNGNMSMKAVTEVLQKAGFKNARCYLIAVEPEGKES